MSTMNWHTCWLRGINHTCDGGYHRHHLINKGKVPKKIRTRAMEASLKQLLVPVCAKANVERIADTKWGQKKLLERLGVEYGEDWARWAIECVLEKFKKRRPPELEYEALMAGPEPPKI